MLDNLDAIADGIREELEARNAVRDDTLTRSRELIRHAANAIKAVHRDDWQGAESALAVVREAADRLVEGVADYPDLYHTGYTQDALKEYVEAFATYALVREQPLPTPQALNVTSATYLNGLAEAATEIRRTLLDIIRHDHSDEAEVLLAKMDAIYNQLMTFDFPDAITYGLRRRVDILRSVLERTRGDLTNSLRQQRLREALKDLEQRLGVEVGTLDDPPEADEDPA